MSKTTLMAMGWTVIAILTIVLGMTLRSCFRSMDGAFAALFAVDHSDLTGIFTPEAQDLRKAIIDVAYEDHAIVNIVDYDDGKVVWVGPVYLTLPRESRSQLAVMLYEFEYLSDCSKSLTFKDYDSGDEVDRYTPADGFVDLP